MVTDDEELSRLAEEALLREAQRGAQMAQISGPSGWLKCRLPSTNKTFLRNTLLGAMASNRAKERQDRSRSERERMKRQQEERERNTYKRLYLHASTKSRNHPPLPSPETHAKEENHGKETKEKRKERESSSQVFMWTDSGLELTGHAKEVLDSKKRKLRDKSNAEKRARGADSSVLSRNIKFVPANREKKDDKR
ncbi:protein POLR1D-like [Eriocheir sinensis]|uniref:protein POLR1D-like n=1 Tax=Eriocheir sinensis TaxID=95602 RepID=UPI0021C85D5F|nr:protein POLR1D-like [Eriocheir sinensis]